MLEADVEMIIIKKMLLVFFGNQTIGSKSEFMQILVFFYEQCHIMTVFKRAVIIRLIQIAGFVCNRLLLYLEFPTNVFHI